YILIENEEITFHEAENLWGLGTYKTQEKLKEKHKINGLRIACIGQAGENLVRYAAIMNDDGRAQGRCGLGTIMGSKNLKAIAIQGRNQIKGQDISAMKKLKKKIEKEKEADLVSSILPKMQYLYGTNMYMDMGMFAGDVPAYYFTETEFPAEKLTEKTIKEEMPVFTSGCAGCKLKCAKHTVLQSKSNEIIVDGPEYETVGSYGPLCGVFNRDVVIKAGHLANKYGIDVISSGVSIAFLIFLVENKIGIEYIKKDLKEFSIKDFHWGNEKIICELIEKIVFRKGVGDILAEGTKRMAQRWNVDPGLAVQVKGLEIPMHDPRAYAGQALTYMTACVGASHEKADWFQTEIGGFEAPEFNIISGPNTDITGREEGVMHLQDLRGIDDSAVNCNFVTLPRISDYARFLNYATDFKYTPKEFMKTGERIFNLKRVISCKMGITRNDDYLPKHVLKVLDNGITAGVKLQLEKNLQEYYKYRGWDWETGQPTKEKLEELGIIGTKVETKEEIDRKKVSQKTKEKIKKLEEKYVPMLKEKAIEWHDLEPYFEFIILIANSEEDFYYDFEVAEENIQFSIKNFPEKKWFWIKIDQGDFETGRGAIENPTIELRFKNKDILVKMMNMDIDVRKAVFRGKIRFKPLGKAKIFSNFFELYLDKIDVEMQV
ncbi:MAG: aldehyde ferredoxin oxidoreductase C-terminal domain-containing protein, partial [Asgard group archaeon]|nr:aldehyde ferredoxin oxidoreductase C-terminal domain-containing protein [Asgard group archaeon]